MMISKNSAPAPSGAVRARRVLAASTAAVLLGSFLWLASPAQADSQNQSDKSAAEEAANALTIVNLDDVRGNLTLPTAGINGAAVSWQSESGKFVTPTGKVSRPAAGAKPKNVKLTATVTVGGKSVKRHFEATLPPLPDPEPLAAYLFTYFAGEQYADGEQIYFGLSRGNDPLHYDDLNSNRPILTSEVGEKGIRDPYLIRSPEGDKFYLIATDLRLASGGGFGPAQTRGSKSIVVWESTDLVTWSEERLVKVSPDTAGNTWAPEAYFDETIGSYVVYWASNLFPESDPQHTSPTYQRMMYATTRDFVTFSEPRVWVDAGYSIIDANVVRHEGLFYRFVNEDVRNVVRGPCSTFVRSDVSAELRSTNWTNVATCIGKPATGNPGLLRGEGSAVFKSNTDGTWYQLIDEYGAGGRGYVPFRADSPAATSWQMVQDYDLPSRPRHGGVLPVTQSEYERLQTAFPND